MQFGLLCSAANSGQIRVKIVPRNVAKSSAANLNRQMKGMKLQRASVLLEKRPKNGVFPRDLCVICAKKAESKMRFGTKKTWLIPSGIEKPERQKYERKTEENALNPDLSEHAKRIVRQIIKNNYYRSVHHR